MTLHRPIVLVGCDSSTYAEDAVAWAAAYARLTGGSLRLLSSWEWPSVQGVPVVLGHYDPQRAATELVARLATDTGLPPEKVATSVVRGNPAPALLEAAVESDLLVVGSHGAGMVSRFALGSVSSRCATHAPCPVVIVRTAADRQPRGVLVGVDESSGASAALRWALDYVEVTGDQLRVLTCVRPVPTAMPVGFPLSVGYIPVEVAESMQPWLEDLVAKELADRGRPLAPAPVVRAVSGDPATELVERSAEAAVTVVGRRGAGGFRRLLLGSVAAALAHHGQSTVVVVPG